MESMTGYGMVDGRYKGLDISVIIRAVNNKFLDINVKMPSFMVPLEHDINNLVRKRLLRGSVTVMINLKNQGPKKMDIDFVTAKKYIKLTRDLIKKNRLETDIDVNILLQLPGVVAVEDFSDNVTKLKTGLLKLVDTALNDVIKMRINEGNNIKKNLDKQLKKIERYCGFIKNKIPLLKKIYKENLIKRLNKLELKFDEEYFYQRLLTEVGIYSEKSNVVEEIVRLESHIGQFKNIMSEKPAGRKLEFLLQEMLREANTISVKTNNSKISVYIVEIKTCLDSLKEQVLNLI